MSAHKDILKAWRQLIQDRVPLNWSQVWSVAQKTLFRHFTTINESHRSSVSTRLQRILSLTPRMLKRHLLKLDRHRSQLIETRERVGPSSNCWGKILRNRQNCLIFKSRRIMQRSEQSFACYRGHGFVKAKSESLVISGFMLSRKSFKYQILIYFY